MRVMATAKEIIEADLWDDFCEAESFSVWAVDEDEEFEVPVALVEKFLRRFKI